ncbi:MAG: PLP-dependent aspartate aminotransferase family protein [Actinomycetota bacterium]|nr:PLP-dependent aspartate aminotransferase family protein [Actinomycetota bacterium]
MRQTTTLVHGDRDLRERGPISPPIAQTSTFESESDERLAELALEKLGHAFYTRHGNPNHAQAAALIAQLEGAETALVTASGMGAATTAVLALTKSGDHIVAQRDLYAGVVGVLLNLVPRFGVEVTQVDQSDVEAFEQAMRPNTTLILLETPSNPKLRVTDLRAVSDIASSHGALTMADNTFATPINQRPLEHGIDLVWHSATKYLGGHSDLSAGAIAGDAELIEQIYDTALLTGAVLGPFDAWLLIRGMRTLELRVERHNANGVALATAASQHEAVSHVHYPGLPDHPQHATAARQMSGYGGVVTLDLGSFEAAGAFIENLRYAKRSASVGSVGSLVIHPAAMWTGVLEPDQLVTLGLGTGLVRFAAGIEDEEDLVEDVIAALDAVRPAR